MRQHHAGDHEKETARWRKLICNTTPKYSNTHCHHISFSEAC